MDVIWWREKRRKGRGVTQEGRIHYKILNVKSQPIQYKIEILF